MRVRTKQGFLEHIVRVLLILHDAEDFPPYVRPISGTEFRERLLVTAPGIQE